MIFNRKKKDDQELINSFGRLKSEAFDFERIGDYFRNKNNNEAFQTISDKTCNDLNIHELFTFIDRTYSKPGQQYLYNRFRNIPANPEALNKVEPIVDAFSSDMEFRITTQKWLSRLNQFETYYLPSLFHEKHIARPKWFFIIPVLSFTSVLSLVLLLFNPVMAFVVFGVFIINTGFHYWNKRNLFQYMVSLPQLLKLNYVAKELFKNKRLKELNPKLKKSTEILDRVKNRMLFFNMQITMQSDFDAIFGGIFEIVKTVFLIEPLLLFGVLKQLDTKRKEIEEVFEFVGLTDTLLSVASLRAGLDSFCIPEIHSNPKKLIAENICHPLITDCVNNSIDIDGKSVLLTGSNMSGKTSFIRTIGINVITGLALNTCFANRFVMPQTRVFSAIRISDDLLNDKSYYFEEVLTIKNMIKKSEDKKPNLFLLDEIFKGTNTVERISAGKAVLSFLAKNKNMVFVSTHDIELADLLKNEYKLFHFSEIVENKTVDFDYKLKDGKLTNRNAIRILEINNYPESVITESIEISKKIDNGKIAN